MKYVLFVFFLVIIVFVNMNFSKEMKTIIIAGDEEDIYTAPYKTSKGELKGICYAIVEKVATELGIKIDYKLMPFDKLLIEAKAGNVDAIMPVIRRKDRLEYLSYPENGIRVEENYLFTLKKYGVSYSGDWADLRSYPIGVVKGYSYGSKFDAAVESKQIQTIEYPGNNAVLEQLKKGKIKIGTGNKDTTGYLKRQLNFDDLVFLEPCLSKDMIYLAFSKKKKGHEELIKQFSDGIEKFRRSEEYQKLLDKYGFSTRIVKLATEEWPPYYGSKMKNYGPITEIITQAFSKVGYKVEIDFFPWVSILEKLKNGRYDAGFAAYYSDQRAKDYIYSEPIGIFSRVVFLKKKTMEIDVKKLEDLKPYRIGVTRGYIYAIPEFDNDQSLNKIESVSEETSIMNLRKGRVDLVIIDKAVASYLINNQFSGKQGDLDFIKSDYPNKKIDMHLLISKKFETSNQLKRDFDYGLKQIKEDGTFDKIIKGYEKKYGDFYETNEIKSKLK